MCVFLFRNEIFMGFQWTTQLPATGHAALCLSEDRQLVHSQGGGLGCGKLYLYCKEHDDQRDGFQPPHTCGGAEGR